MESILAYEKKRYFPTRRDYWTCRITHEDNYLIWKYQSFLRREESAGNKLTAYYWRRRKNDLGSRLGLQIYAGTCGRGLKIWHYGSIIISGDAKLGPDCVFHGQACIGSDGISDAAPVLGSHVDIGAGAKIIGGVTIADHVRIGAGAVVTRSCDQPGAVLAGVPARILHRDD